MFLLFINALLCKILHSSAIFLHTINLALYYKSFSILNYNFHLFLGC